MYSQTIIQIGKNGLTSGIIENLKAAFTTHNVVKVHVLKAARTDKESVIEIAKKIISALGNKYTCKIIGFVIIVRKWRKAQTEN